MRASQLCLQDLSNMTAAVVLLLLLSLLSSNVSTHRSWSDNSYQVQEVPRTKDCVLTKAVWTGARQKHRNDECHGLLHYLSLVVQRLEWKEIIILTNDVHLYTDFKRCLGERAVLLTEVFLQDSHDTTDSWNTEPWTGCSSCDVLVLGSVWLQRQMLQKLSSNNTERFAPYLLDMHWLFWLEDHMVHDAAVTSLTVNNLAAVRDNKQEGFSLLTLLWTSAGREFVDVTNDISRGNMALTLYPNTNFGLNGMTVRVGVNSWYSALIVDTRQGHTVYRGFCVDLLNILSDHLNFSYTLTMPEDGQFGDLVNGRWTGLMGMLNRKEIDLALPLAPRLKRRQVGEWTDSMFFSSTTVVYRLQKTIDSGWSSFLRPLHWQVYLCLACSFVFSGTMCLALIYYQQHSVHWSLSSNTSVFGILEKVYLAMLNKPISKGFSGPPLNVFFASWCLLGLFMTFSYTSNLTSLLVSVTSKPPFTSLTEMVAQSHYEWGMIGASSYVMDFRDSDRSLDQEVYRKMLSFAKSDPDVFSADLDVHRLKVQTEPYAFIGDSMGISIWAAHSCDLYVFPNPDLSLESNVIFAPHNSSMTQRLNIVLMKLRDNGILDHLHTLWFPSPRHCQDHQHSAPSKISLTTLQGPFLLAGAGLFMALVLLVLERVVPKASFRRYIASEAN